MKKIIELSNACNVRNINIEFISARLNSAVYTARSNIVRQNVLIKRMQRNKNAMYVKTFIEYSTLNASKNK